ncbi:Potassium voltage-gated channel sub D member 2 [Phlyctochytrium planicorne]|nr:Potassium voltage-gated channel sub D member 2 [Phlyctochytrium planicorne]
MESMDAAIIMGCEDPVDGAKDDEDARRRTSHRHSFHQQQLHQQQQQLQQLPQQQQQQQQQGVAQQPHSQHSPSPQPSHPFPARPIPRRSYSGSSGIVNVNPSIRPLMHQSSKSSTSAPSSKPPLLVLHKGSIDGSSNLFSQQATSSPIAASPGSLLVRHTSERRPSTLSRSGLWDSERSGDNGSMDAAFLTSPSVGLVGTLVGEGGALPGTQLSATMLRSESPANMDAGTIGGPMGMLGRGLGLDPETATIRSRRSMISVRAPSAMSRLSGNSLRPDPKDNDNASGDPLYVRKRASILQVEDEPSKLERQLDDTVNYMNYMPMQDMVDVYDTPTSTESEIAPSNRPQWLINLSILMKDRSSSRMGKALNTFFLCVLLVSIVAFCLSTMQVVMLNPKYSLAVFSVDFACIIVFTIEYILRVMVAETWSELFSPLLIIDLISILPFYIELGIVKKLGGDMVEHMTSVEGVSALRALRLVRTFRILKFVRKSAKLAIILQAVKSSMDGIAVLMVTVSVLIVFYSSLLFYAEQVVMTLNADNMWTYPDGSISPYQSIPECFYYLVGSLTGNPPEVPKSPYSKLVISFCMITSVFILAFPLTIITISYSKTIRAFTQAQKQKRERKERERQQRLQDEEEKKALAEFEEAERERQLQDEEDRRLGKFNLDTEKGDDGQRGSDIEGNGTAQNVTLTDLTALAAEESTNAPSNSSASNDTLNYVAQEVPTIIATPAAATIVPAVGPPSVPLPATSDSSNTLSPPGLMVPLLAVAPGGTRPGAVLRPIPSSPRLSASGSVISASVGDLGMVVSSTNTAKTSASLQPPLLSGEITAEPKQTTSLKSSVKVLTAVNALKKPLLKSKKPAGTGTRKDSGGSPVAGSPTHPVGGVTTSMVNAHHKGRHEQAGGALLLKTQGRNVGLSEMYATVGPLIGGKGPKDLEIRILDWTYLRPAPPPPSQRRNASSTDEDEEDDDEDESNEDDDDEEDESENDVEDGDEAQMRLGYKGRLVPSKIKKKKDSEGKVVKKNASLSSSSGTGTPVRGSVVTATSASGVGEGVSATPPPGGYIVPLDAPDRLSMRIVVRDQEHFKRIMKVLSEIS